MKLRNILFIFVFFIITVLFFQQVGVAITVRKAIKTSLSRRRVIFKILPEKQFHYEFQNNIASTLRWIPTKGIRFFCHGYFEEPLIVSDSRLASVKKEPDIITISGSSTLITKTVSLLEKDVVVTQPGRVVNADKAYIYRDEKTDQINKIVLIGHIRLCEVGKLITADRGKITLYPKTAVLKNMAYRIYNGKSYIPPFKYSFNYPFNAWGRAKQATQDAPSQVVILQRATYSTCNPTQPTWWLSATKLVLNKQIHRGEAYNALLRFYGFPIFYFPYYNFPIDNYRKTGFLTPRIGLSASSGKMFFFPFYWNMAPNYDLTLTPELMTKRGLSLCVLFRFLSAKSMGNMYLNYLPNDTVFQRFREKTLSEFSNPAYTKDPYYAPYFNQLKNIKNQRGFFSMNEHTVFNPAWSSDIILNYVTDSYFFQDSNSQINVNPLANQLLNRMNVEYSGLHWHLNGMLQAYQTLHVISQISKPAFDQYARLADFNADGYYPDILPHTDFNLNAEATNFNYQSSFASGKPIGQRFHIRPSLSFPFYFASGYIIPQIRADATMYNAKYPPSSQEQVASRLLPILDLNLGLYFYQYFNLLGNSLIQTFEPRLFYLYIPYQNQDKLPNFDTVLLPFAFEQLFAVNQYTGDDRLQNANQVSIGFTSHIFSSITGVPILTTNFGLMYLVENRRVCLSSASVPFNAHFSPIVSELILYPFSHWILSSNIVWNPNFRQTNNSYTEISYINGRQKVDIGCIFMHENRHFIVSSNIISPSATTHNANNTAVTYLSVIWPFFSRWSVTNYWDYDITHHHHTNSAAVSVQYNACCWALSFVARRTYIGLTLRPVSSSKNSYNTTFFIQLGLKGLGDFKTPLFQGNNYLSRYPSFQ